MIGKIYNTFHKYFHNKNRQVIFRALINEGYQLTGKFRCRAGIHKQYG